MADRIGIRREDKNAWERRAPLTPDHVAELVGSHGLDVSVQPSPLRAFPDDDYRAAGARIEEDLAACRVVFGIKEIPVGQLQPGGTYVYFSHTTKGQPHNMPMLRRLLGLRCTLVDYERVLDGRGRRLIFFGRHAGYAGMIDALWALGRRLAAEGHVTPLTELRLAHEYPNLDAATHHVSRVGESLRHGGIPAELRPIVCGFTGSGNVALGAQEIFDRLPFVEVDAAELEAVVRDAQQPRNVLYKVVFRRDQRFERIGGGAVDLEELAREPSRYDSGLPRWLPYLTVLVHGAFWDPRQPRLLTLDHLQAHWAQQGRSPRLRLIADISCDVQGGIEATVRPTSPGDPVYVYDLERREATDDVVGFGPTILAVDNLPCQLPLESSQHFGDTLLRFVASLARCPWDLPFEHLPLSSELRDAIIAHRGRLAPAYAHLERHLAGP